MSEDNTAETKDCKCKKSNAASQGAQNTVYGFGFLGAVIYFIIHSTGFWGVVVGILKAFIWPAFLVYKVLEYFKM